MIELALVATFAALAGVSIGLWLGERRLNDVLSDLVRYGSPRGKTEPAVYEPPDEEQVVRQRVGAATVRRLKEHIEQQGVSPDKAQAEAERLVHAYEATASDQGGVPWS